VIEVDRAELLLLVQKDSELGDILMRAFILRRVMLIAGQFGDVVLVGSTHCAGTLRVKEFLTRNGHPYSYVDLDRDDGVQELLDHFHISAADVPILICRGKVVLLDPTNEEIAACLGFNDAIDQTHIRDAVMVGAGPSGGGGRLCCVGRTRCFGTGVECAGRTGRFQLKNRKLPWFSVGNIRTGTGSTCLYPSTEVGAELMIAKGAKQLACQTSVLLLSENCERKQ
jgi:thioredoxin reductase (NADPH)